MIIELRQEMTLIKFLAYHFFILFNQLKPPSAKPQIVFYSKPIVCMPLPGKDSDIQKSSGICSKRTWFRETPNSGLDGNETPNDITGNS